MLRTTRDLDAQHLPSPPGQPEPLCPCLSSGRIFGRSSRAQAFGPAPPPARRRQGQDHGRRAPASTGKVRSQRHLISEQVSLSYEMSLQFALAPLGGGFLKQRDRLGAGRSRRTRAEKQDGDGERNRDTDIKHQVHMSGRR